MPKTPQAKPWTFWQVLGFISSSSINHEPHQAKNPPINYFTCVFPTYARMCSWFWSCQAENVLGYLSLTYCRRYSARRWRHCLPGLVLKNSADLLAMAGLNPPLLWRFSLWWYPLRGLIIADIVIFLLFFKFSGANTSLLGAAANYDWSWNGEFHIWATHCSNFC